MLLDPTALTGADMESEGEQRFVTVGMDTLGRILVVVYDRGEDVRLISARSATKRERMQYGAGI